MMRISPHLRLRPPDRPSRRRSAAAVAALAVVGGLLSPLATAPAAAAPVGQGFNLNASDLRYILKQIKIAENHVANTTSATGPCGAMLGSGADQIPDNGVGVTLPWGLRTISGICNNIEVDQADYGRADRAFPRLVPRKLRSAESGDPDGPGPAPNGPTTYQQTSGTVINSQIRTVSNLVVDQTETNPAAVAAGGENPEVDARTGSILIPNVATDTGLSAPYNSWFTLFGQFFDHGLDLVNKGGNGTVLIPLKTDDPRYVPGSPTNFMVLTRATQTADGEAMNQTSPFVDQSQTYTSHPSHQVFLREYELVADRPESTGRLITGTGDGMADWTTIKAQAETMLGIRLVDTDVTRVPLLDTDAYGRFTRGPNGFPQMIVPAGADGILGNEDDGLVEGNPAAPVTTAGSTPSGHAFLDDIAHHAVPTGDIDPSDGPSQVVPLAPDSDPGTTDDGDRATYDDEMLGAHFIAGDGRVNENIGLTAVHHVFHSEHNRLTGDIAGILDSAAVTAAQRAEWHATGPSGWDYEERLFQAARFVTEMEYQHLAFEEFARKVQPMVNLFGEGGTGYHSNIDPAITAEFAHAVYRFGHSMLTESVDRVTAGGTKRNIALLDAFLNPPSFLAGGSDPNAAAGDIVRGMTRQVGNELDEFVTDALRNDLLGLPLDLATLNMARARETGVPTLNEARRKFYATTTDSALAPYTSWADLGFNLKHAESLANFIAAYGTHPTITAETTTVGKRAAAEALLADATDPDPLISEDAYAFLNSTDAYANDANGVTTTGVDDIDLWVGGLAEKQMVFGGLLGPTFNYVFEGQMEDLQDGDRFYYLSRTAGLNLLTQLEGNSFAELIQRNTDVEGLPADSFSRPDYVFNVANLGTSGPIPDDVSTEDWNEATMLTRTPDGTIRYAGPAHVVFNGSPGNDRIHSSEGDDTLRGNDGNDRIEGGDGADNLIGGDGDDILTDLFGDDVLKGGDGNDALSSGRGFGGDLNQSGRGSDFVVGGNDTTETFAGPGDDFVFAGDAEDTVFGDDGDDWIEGGKGPFNLLQGDNGAPFQDDPNEPGHDVLFSYGGEQDYDAEGGDDVMLLGPGIQRAEGMLGFDWTSHKSDPQAGNSDMDITGLLPPSVETNRDRFDLVESLSGWKFNDILRGDSRVAADMEGHELDAAGIARVDGLSTLLDGATSFTGGNILMGGEGADLIEGRGGDDLIHGDVWLNVQLRAPDLVNGGTKLVDDMSALRADVFAGRINPGAISIFRSIQPGAPGIDTAVFTGPRADYTIEIDNGTITVTDTVGTDGVDRLLSIERLQFSDQTVSTAIPSAPVDVAAVAGDTSATVSWSPGPANGADPATEFRIQVVEAGVVTRTVSDIPGSESSSVVSGLTNGTTYTFRVLAVNGIGASAPSADSNAVTPVDPTPRVTSTTPSDSATGVATDANLTGLFNQAVTGVSTTSVTLRVTSSGAAVPAAVTYDSATRTVTLNPNADLAPLTSYTFTLSGAGAGGIRGTDGTQLVTTTVVFTSAADTSAPTITGSTPANNATGAAANTNVVVTFSEPVLGLVPANVRLRNAGNTQINGAVTVNAARTQVTFNPTPTLALNTQYTLTLTGGTGAIRDNAGNPLATSTITFRTVGDTTAPTVTTTTPANNAVNVRPGANLVVNFSEAVTGFNAGSVELRNLSTGAVIGRALTTNGAGTRLTINPNPPLVRNTLYRLTLTGSPTGIRDAAGNPLVTRVITFRTR